MCLCKSQAHVAPSRPQTTKVPPAGWSEGQGRTAYRRGPCFLLSCWGWGTHVHTSWGQVSGLVTLWEYSSTAHLPKCFAHEL